MKTDLLLTSDWHIRSSTPTCRTDNFYNAQWEVIYQINRLQQKYNCPILHGGDLFDKWKISTELLIDSAHHIPDKFYTVIGNHDLPQNNLSLSYKSGISALENFGFLNVLHGYHEGQTPKQDHPSFTIKGRKIMVWHKLVYQGKPFPGAEKGMAGGVLRKHPEYDLILTGDNHQSFVEEYEGRYLVNPGNITRQKADQIDFKPRIFRYNAKHNKVSPIELDVPDGVIRREHIEVKKDKDKRINAFVERLDKEWDVDLDFEENIREFAETNDVDEDVMDKVYEAIEQ